MISEAPRLIWSICSCMEGNNSLLLLLSVRETFETLRNLTLRVALLDGFAFVETPFPLSDAELDLGEGSFEIDAEWNETQSFFLHPAEQFSDLPLRQKHFSGAAGIMIQVTAVFVGADVHPEQPHFTIFYMSVAVLKVGIAGAKGLDLRAHENEPCLERVENEIIVPRLAVGYNNSLFFLSHPARNFV